MPVPPATLAPLLRGLTSHGKALQWAGMEEDSKRACAHCGAALEAGAETCPHCGREQPVRWMVILAYGLLALFVLGVIYRLIRP